MLTQRELKVHERVCYTVDQYVQLHVHMNSEHMTDILLLHVEYSVCEPRHQTPALHQRPLRLRCPYFTPLKDKGGETASHHRVNSGFTSFSFCYK